MKFDEPIEIPNTIKIRHYNASRNKFTPIQWPTSHASYIRLITAHVLSVSSWQATTTSDIQTMTRLAMIPNLLVIFCFLLLSPSYGANLEHSPPALPPCGSYHDCTTGAHNFLPYVPNLSTCQAHCARDPHCQFYSYNYSVTSHLYQHCFLHSTCTLAQHSSPGGWVSGPRECFAPPLLGALRSANNGLLRTTKWSISWWTRPCSKDRK